MSYYCNVHYINVFYSEPNASCCFICPLSLSLSLSLSLYDLQFQTFTFNLQPKKTTMTISCITASISILSHYQSAHDHGLVVDSLSCGSERIFILTSLGLRQSSTIATVDPFSAFTVSI